MVVEEEGTTKVAQAVVFLEYLWIPFIMERLLGHMELHQLPKQMLLLLLVAAVEEDTITKVLIMAMVEQEVDG
jgi:hypothetical protein